MEKRFSDLVSFHKHSPESRCQMHSATFLRRLSKRHSREAFMRILFLNYTFPGPFQHLAASFGRRADTTTLFAAECGRRNFSIPGVQRVILSRPKGKSPKSKVSLSEEDRLEWDISMAFQRGRMTASSLLKLKERGFVPDIIFSSATMGNSLFMRMVFPESFWIVYGDWYFARRKALPEFGGKTGPSRAPSMWWSNNLQLRALCESNLMVTSTDWQRRQYPPEVANNLHIVPLCVDTDFFSPVPKEMFSIEDYDFSQADEIVTIAGKGIDQASFFRTLMSLPFLLERRRRCHVVLLTGMLFSEAVSFFEKKGIAGPFMQRIHPVSFLPDDAYRALLRASSLYVYPACSTMLSVGILEAMSCGCLSLVGDTEAAREIIQHGENGLLYRDKESYALADTIIDILKNITALESLRVSQRKKVQDEYSVRRVMYTQIGYILKRYSQWKMQPLIQELI